MGFDRKKDRATFWTGLNVLYLDRGLSSEIACIFQNQQIHS